MIERLAEESGAASEPALAEFCRSYRAPLLAYTSYHYPNDAEDLVHGFFERIIEQRILQAADPEKGNLRNFLLTCLKRHISNHYRDLRAAKRGGGAEHLSVEAADEIADSALDAEALYHRRWAHEVLEHAVGRIREDWTRAGKSGLFEELFPFLGFQRHEEEKLGDIAVRLGMSSGALKTAIYRIRREYREALLVEIARTLKVRSRDQVMTELRELMGRV